MLVISVISVLIWCVGYLCFMTYLYLQAVSQSIMLRNPKVGILLLPAFSRYEDEYFWFGLVILFRRLLLAIVPVIDNVDTRWQMALLCLVLLSSLFVNEYLKPYRFSLLHLYDTVPLYIQIFVCVLIMMTHAKKSEG